MVRFKIRVEILSKADMKEIERETVTLEKTVRRQTIAKDKLGISRKKRGGIFAEENKNDVLPSAILKQRQKGDLSRSEEQKLLKKDKDKFTTAGELSKETFLNNFMIKAGLKKKGGITNKALAKGVPPITKQNPFKALKKQVALNTKAMTAMQKGMQGFMQFGALGRGGAGGLLGMGLGLASKIIPVGIAITIAKMAIDIWVASYGAGGVNDPRKKVLNDIRSFIGIERETDIISGRQFFANSRTLGMNQETRTNTMNLMDGYTLSKLNRSGYGR